MHRNESVNPWIVHFCWHHLLCQPRKRCLHHFAMQSCVCLCKQCRVQRFSVYCSFFSFLYCKKSMNRIRCHCQVPVKCVSLLLVCSGRALSTTWLCTSSWMGKVMEHGLSYHGRTKVGGAPDTCGRSHQQAAIGVLMCPGVGQRPMASMVAIYIGMENLNTIKWWCWISFG